MNPYGLSKLMGEQILHDYYKAYGINVVCFRYFNVAGAWDDVGDHGMSDHVIQKMISSAVRESDFVVYGNDKKTPDGTCVRDYLHVRDVCDAHIAAINYLNTNPGYHIYNLGTGNGVSVRQLAASFIINTKRNVHMHDGDSRDGDPDFLVADGHRFKADTGYTYNHSDINNIIKTAWNYSSMKKQHYVI
jgi:UDP-glucose 4-epimerase